MARSGPSLVALLGLLAVAGYQNRDKIGAMLQNAGGANGMPGRSGSGDTGPLGDLGSLFGGSGGGGNLVEGLRSLVERFRDAGRGDLADSWVASGPNRDLSPSTMSSALDEELLTEIERRTGLGRDEIVSRLSQTVPQAVDAMTPLGRLPTDDEARVYL
jgi:uncharacterized protein YidB (DUF937 family)